MRFDKPAALHVTLRVAPRVMRSSGRVFGDHYHSRIVQTPAELVNAIAYVLGNHAHHHGGSVRRDPFSSAAYASPVRERVLADPRTWLLRVGWRRARSLPHHLEGAGSQGRAQHGDPDP